MSVDLTGQIPGGNAKIRIETNMRIYWDRARVMLGGDETKLAVQRLKPLSAEMRFGGFPHEISPDGKKPHDYDPARTSEYRNWKAHVGAYTAFGEVTELLSGIDDRFVTTRNGDEVELSFAAPPPPASGWTRTYLVFADGFGKDMDPNSAANNTVEPIPFHGMPGYPYGPEVMHPAVALQGPPYRWVPPSNSGWPGARPQALAAVRD